jgi:predicted O-linked N-acetylglucosamine transferase (SPINDLY family)
MMAEPMPSQGSGTNFAKALAAHKQGSLSEAEALYSEILQANPADFNSMHLLGVIALQTGRTAQGVELIRNAIKLNENVADAHSHLGNGLRKMNLPEEALASYDKAIALKLDHADAFNNRGIVLCDLKRLEQALASFERAIALKPDYAEAHVNKGNALRQLRRVEEAIASYDKVILLQPGHAEVHNSRGAALMELRRFEEARASFEAATALNPRFAAAHNNHGIALFELRRIEEAITSYGNAIAAKPDQAEAHNNRGNAFRALKRLEEALEDYGKAIALRPGYFEAHYHRGNTLWELGRPEDALASYNAAIALKPDHAGVHNNRGIALWGLKRLAEAVEAYDASIARKPDHAEAYNNRGTALLEQNRPKEALASLQKAIELRPGYPDAVRNHATALSVLRRFDESFETYDRLFNEAPTLTGVEGQRLNAKLQLCDWRDIDSESVHLVQSIRSGIPATQPFYLLAAPSSPGDQLQCSRLWTKTHYPLSEPPVWRGEKYQHDRIRVGYVSADFRHHPMAYLAAGMFESHDRSRFEVTAISLSPDDGSEIRQRLQASFERFVDASSLGDDQIAELVREQEIDILVDLMGFTTHARTAIFARRPAPIQVSYLGYPGTMGAPYIDYLVADRIVIPDYQRQHYSESVVFLPDSYFVNDSRRAIAETQFSREQLGLPPTGFVFCCFNTAPKISPEIFGCWMRILKQVPGSVFWLLESSLKAMENLKNEAVARGIDPGRLVFAPHMAPAEHLARHRLADLCLDTLPYNAHTTACDALWAGTPIVTCLGETFVGRVATSLLYAIKLPELVRTTLQGYERLAIELAMQPVKLAGIKRRLAANRDSAPLFDTALFTRRIEAAFSGMIDRQQAGEMPADITVPQ